MSTTACLFFLFCTSLLWLASPLDVLASFTSVLPARFPMPFSGPFATIF